MNIKEVASNPDSFLGRLRNGAEVPPEPDGFTFRGPDRYEHQKVIFWHGIVHAKYAIFSDMGTGKTAAAIDIAACRMEYGQVNKALIFCPTTVLYNWKDEISLFSDKSAEVLYGSISTRKQLLDTGDTDFFIINYEGVRLLKRELASYGFDMLILDESVRVKTPTSQVSRAAYHIAQPIDYRLLLSGQPIENSPIDLFQQFLVLDNGATFGSNFYAFRAKYFNRIRMGRFSKWVINKSKLDEIAEKVKGNSVRYVLNECVSLPEKTYRKITLDMLPDQRRLYEDIAHKTIVDLGEECGLEDGRVSMRPGVAITKVMKLSQVCSGFLYTKRGDFVLTSNPKLEYLSDFLKETTVNYKVVVWCKYRKSIELIADLLSKLKIGYTTFWGGAGQTARDKRAAELKLQSDDKCRVLVGQIKAGIGTTFTSASYALYFENEWSLGAREQSERRIYRIGQNRKVVIIDLVMRNSVEEKVYLSLKEKVRLASLIMNDDISEFLGVKGETK